MAEEISLQRKEHDAVASNRLLGLAEELYNQFLTETIPNVNLPTRTKKNIEYSEESDVWVYGDRETERSAKTVKGAFQLLKTTHVVDFLVNNHLNQNRGSTLREFKKSTRELVTDDTNAERSTKKEKLDK